MIYRVIKEIEEGISEQFPVNLFLVNQRGLLVWVNDNMLKLSKVSNFSEIKGIHISYFGKKSWEMTSIVIKTRKRVTLYEEKDGKTFYVMKIPFTKGGFRGVLGFSIDITVLKQAENAKQEFLMNMSHDVRTPFCGIIGVFEILNAGERNLKKKKWIETGLQSSKRLLNFMNDICNFLS